MPFLIFSKKLENGGTIISYTGNHFKLAGSKSGLIYKTWKKKGRPLEQGWHINADELLREQESGLNSDNACLVIDRNPNSDTEIGLIMISDIYVYTFSDDNDNNTVGWSPMMLKLKNIHVPPSKKGKEEALKRIVLKDDPEGIIEFLYLKGDNNSWSWGRNGGTNAAFLHKESLQYFKQYF